MRRMRLLRRMHLFEPGSNLRAIGESTHTGQHAKHVVALGEDERGREVAVDIGDSRVLVQDVSERITSRGDGSGLGREHQRRVVDTAKVTRPGWLHDLLGLERERIVVDAGRRRASSGLERLYLVEVRSLALIEPVVSVQLELGGRERRPAIVGRSARADGVPTVLRALEHPGKRANRVVQVEPNVISLRRRARGDRLSSGVLQTGDEKLVAALAEPLALAAVKVDVVSEELGRRVDRGIDTVRRHHGGSLEGEGQPHLVICYYGRAGDV